MAAKRDVFRLVSVRSADQSRSEKPDQHSLPSKKLLRIKEAVLRSHSPEALAHATADLSPMEPDELAGSTPWLELATEFAANPGKELDKATINGGTEEMTLAKYATTVEFQAAYDHLALSWLTLLAQARAGQDIPTELLAHHEVALHFAAVIRELGRGSRRVDAVGTFTLPLVTPASWRQAKRHDSVAEERSDSDSLEPDPSRGEVVAYAQTADFGVDSDGRNQNKAGLPVDAPAVFERALTMQGNPAGPTATRLATLRAERADTVDQVRGLQQILVAAHVLGDLMMGDTDGTPIGEYLRFIAALQARIPRSARPTLNVAINDHGATTSRSGFIAGLDPDLSIAIDTANALCKQIRVFEEELTTQLPVAGLPKAGAHPAVRAVGWGDLFVVREELVGYEAREISHIENVMPGEAFDRTFDHRHRTVQVDETETSTDSTTENDLETTDRYDTQAEAAKTIQTDFATQAGVNVSGTYGLTTVAASVAAQTTTSTNASTQSATQIAKDVVAKTVTRTQTKSRELRRTTTSDTVRELATHSITNTTTGTGSAPKPQSGVYLWVEKVQRMQLYQYGRRLMIEFMIPEPGLSLIEAGQPVRLDVQKPLALAIGPSDIDETNYLCLVERYEARDVTPPPALLLNVGEPFASEVDQGAGGYKAEWVARASIPVPIGYEPISGRFTATGRGRTEGVPQSDGSVIDKGDPIHLHLAVGGQVVEDSALELLGTPNQRGQMSYHGPFELRSPAVTDDKGVPVTVRLAGAADNAATVNVSLTCRRSLGLLATWRLETYQRIVEAHDRLQADYQDALTRARFGVDADAQVFGNRPAEQNRVLERDELKKWAVKLMRAKSYTFDAVVGDEGFQEIDPVVADDEAPVIRLFEQSFEWDQMSYFLEPYFWGRRGSWTLRQKISVPNDPTHESFLRAGAARVLVPVTPGSEATVLDYLESDPSLPDWRADLAATYDIDNPPRQRIRPTPLDLANADDSDFGQLEYADIWLELIEEYKPDVLRGSGQLSVTQNAKTAQLIGTSERVSARDVGREVYLDGECYEISSVDTQQGAAAGTSFDLDRPYEGLTATTAYAIGSLRRGAPWDIRVPTTLVILADNKGSLAGLA